MRTVPFLQKLCKHPRGCAVCLLQSASETATGTVKPTNLETHQVPSLEVDWTDHEPALQRCDLRNISQVIVGNMAECSNLDPALYRRDVGPFCR